MKIQPGVGYTFDSSAHGFTLDTSDPFPSSSVQPSTHPFKIINARLITVSGTTTVIYQVQSGTINNLVPLIDDYVSSTTVKLDRTTSGLADPPTAQLSSTDYDATTKTAYIALRSGPSSSTGAYPDNDDTTSRYPVIVPSNDPLVADTDTAGFLFIGTITVDDVTTPTTFTVSQNVTGSLWSDRIKLAGITAKYFYARI